MLTNEMLDIDNKAHALWDQYSARFKASEDDAALDQHNWKAFAKEVLKAWQTSIKAYSSVVLVSVKQSQDTEKIVKEIKRLITERGI